MIRYKGPVLGFENLVHLQTLQIHTIRQFPVRFIASIALSLPSRPLRALTVYIEAEAKTAELDAYEKLDDALCNAISKQFALRMYILGSDSHEVVSQWQKQLSVLLPNSCALERFTVERAHSNRPRVRWLNYRDGF